LPLKLFDARHRGDPAPGVRRLHDDDLDLGRTVKGPRKRALGRSSVEQALRGLLGLDHYAVAELPVQHDDAPAQPADQVGVTEHAVEFRHASKANLRLLHEGHLLVGVDLVQCGKAKLQLIGLVVVELVLGDDVAHVAVLGQQVFHAAVQHGALGHVLVLDLRRHALHERHAAGAGDHAVGGRAADDL
jgi:hypothetical protein